MPPASEVQQHLTGAWQMMLGRREGLNLLDISADGFWNSFHAITISLPPLLLGWALHLRETGYTELDDRLVLVARLALIDLSAWLLPIAGLAAVARQIGIAGRFTHYVVASNWGTALLVWLMLPVSLLQLLFPDRLQLVQLFALMALVIGVILGWRLTFVALARGPWQATGLYLGMGAASVLVTLLLGQIM